MTGLDREEDFAAESRVAPPAWHLSDRVRIVGGSPQLLGAIGTVVEMDLPGPSPIRVQVEGRRGFGQVLRAPHELEPEDETTA